MIEETDKIFESVLVILESYYSQDSLNDDLYHDFGLEFDPYSNSSHPAIIRLNELHTLWKELQYVELDPHKPIDHEEEQIAIAKLQEKQQKFEKVQRILISVMKVK